MINFAICDDDEFFAKMLRDQLNNILFSVSDGVDYEVSIFTCAAELLEHSTHSPVNILFLDIDMPCINGFEVAETLSKSSPDTMTVFVSAYDSFVYDSFQFGPQGYIRKEHLKDELKPLVKRVLKKFFESSETMTVKTVDGEVIIRLRDICLIESSANYYEIHLLAGRRYKCRGPLRSVEDMLSKKDFYRIHKAYIVYTFFDTIGKKMIYLEKNRRLFICQQNTE